jgi:putative tricarboxylic transport membrane protein
MVDGNALQGALALLASDVNIWLFIIPGLMIGLVAGAIAGVSNSMAMAICLPLTLYMDFMPAVMFLTAIFTGSGFGGAVTSILMGIPGTTSAVATTFDGYPMARKGQHNEALGVALLSSVVAVLYGYLVLFFIIGPLGAWVIRLGAAEMLLIALWGLSMIAILGGKDPIKGLMAGGFGLLLGTIGMNTSGYIRGTMDVPFLLEGIPLVPAMMGMFAASQLLTLVGTKFLVSSEDNRRADYRRIIDGARIVLRHPWFHLKGSMLPGVGSSVGNLIAYAEAKRTDDDPESYGKGNPKGVIAAESANSSSEGGSMVTMLALGIPGGGGTAMLLAAFMMHNVTGGPQFISANMDIVYAIIFGNFIQAALLLVFGLGFLAVAGNIVRVPLTVLIPSVMILAVIGSFAITGDKAGPITLFFFAGLGWLMKRYDYPIAATVIGLLLGRMVESELIRTWQISGGMELSFFLGRPVAMVFGFLLILSLLQPLLKRKLKARRRARAAAA